MAAPVTAVEIQPPEDIPPDIFDAAVATFLDCRRLDMRALATTLGMGRATLYRKVGNRDRLLGEVVWYLAQRALQSADEASAHLRGAERVVAAAEHFMRITNSRRELRRLLAAEPETALRVLTSKHGPVQRGITDAVEGLLAEEEEAGNLELTIERGTLAYVIVRIGESFMYADVIADGDPDVGAAVELLRRLLREA